MTYTRARYAASAAYRRGEVRNPLAYVALAIVAIAADRRPGVALRHAGRGAGQSLRRGLGTRRGRERQWRRHSGRPVPRGRTSRHAPGPSFRRPCAERADTIVWFPSDLQKPPDDVRRLARAMAARATRPHADLRRPRLRCRAGLLEEGLRRRAAPSSPPSSPCGNRRPRAISRSFASRCPPREDWRWFTMDGTLKHRQVTTLDGRPALDDGRRSRPSRRSSSTAG